MLNKILNNKKYLACVIGATLLLAVIAGFLIMSGHKSANTQTTGDEILFYTCGMHPSVKVSVEEYEKGNKSCPICNMFLTPVYKDAQLDEGKVEKKVLFYRNPMNPEITSVEPAKDEMGMDYTPVYEDADGDDNYYGCGMEGGEHVFALEGAKGMKCPICGMPLKKLTKDEADQLRGIASRVKIKDEQIKRAGAVMEPIQKLELFKEIRTTGRVAYDPALATTEEEYLSAIKALRQINRGSIPEISGRAKTMVESAERKLKLLGLSDEQIQNIKSTKNIHSNLILPEKKMWIYGDVYEYELAWLKKGEPVSVLVPAMPHEVFNGIIVSVHPLLDPKTRAVRFMVEVLNDDLKLKPDMFVDVIIKSKYLSPSGDSTVLAIPKSALLDTGRRKIVWFEENAGFYEGRVVQVGPEASATIDGVTAKYYPLISGGKAGEMVVTKANFLIDSQSQLSGVAASAYSGALGTDKKMDEDEENKIQPAHQH